VRNGFRLSGIKQPILLKSGDNALSLSIDTDRSAPPGIHAGFLEVRLADEDTKPLLVFNVRVMTSRFWFSPIWAWIASGLLFLAGATLRIVARPPRSNRVNRIEEPSRDRPVFVDPVKDRLQTLLAAKKASLNELQISLSKSRQHIGELERRCALLEREISELTSSLMG
jgi:hypothetical protein